jgi:hypothetical protein
VAESRLNFRLNACPRSRNDPHKPEENRLIFYLCTALLGVNFVSLILRTPLRWVLGGPVRAKQREAPTAIAGEDERQRHT